MVSGGSRAASAVTQLPRLVVAAPASGHGKTTVATGLMAALRGAGHRVSGHKIGPDYLDPGYHALATDMPGRNLDPHLVGEERIAPLLLHGAQRAEVAVIEGVMGLYDGQVGTSGYASTAHVAALTRSPIILVVDISHASRSIAAMIHGMQTFDPDVHIGGVILNKAGSARHAEEVRDALEVTGIPVLGVLYRDDALRTPSWDRGLIPAAERADAVHSVNRIAARIADAVDLEQIMRIARQASALNAVPWQPELPGGGGEQAVVAVASGRAFSFRYSETLELLTAAGLQPVFFDPLTDECLPEGTQGIYLGGGFPGGFPEGHATSLAANLPLRQGLRASIDAGMPVVAECAGLLYLCRSLDEEPMVGAINAHARMTSQLTLAYRNVTAPHDHLLATAGTQVTGHEYHRAALDPTGDSGWLSEAGPTGFGTATMHASYVHTHWAGHPQLAERFCAAVRGYAKRAPQERPLRSASSQRLLQQDDCPAVTDQPEVVEDHLRFHGDAELADDLVDFAVNIDDSGAPQWLMEAIAASLREVDRYPDATAAHLALARRHGRDPAEVIPTAGAAEAFSLIARCRKWRRPVIIHPQFTEPDVTLEAAGYRPEHVVLEARNGFALDPGLVPHDADLVIVGNPTNPTSVLHPQSVIRELIKPGRLLVIDEAFMDAVPGEQQSWATSPRAGMAVVRSLTKTWAIPGVRAGYVLTDPDTRKLLHRQQPAWSVSMSAAAAMLACSTDEAIAETNRRAQRCAENRAVLVDGLAELGITIGGTPAAPFVLARLGNGAHQRLRDAGYAVRRADTFPGLDGSWVRIAVRAPGTTRKLLAVLRSEGAPWM